MTQVSTVALFVLSPDTWPTPGLGTKVDYRSEDRSVIDVPILCLYGVITFRLGVHSWRLEAGGFASP